MTEPVTGPEIADALVALHHESVQYWASFTAAAFLAPLGEAWSPADTVRHLTKSIRAVTAGLRLPRWLMRLTFGGTNGTSRSYLEMRDFYRARLAQGASAGRFAPAPHVARGPHEADRARIMAFHATAVTTLVGRIRAWPEPALDRRRLPHPLLGPLTVREMLFFTVYHNRHHLDGVRRRVAATPPAAPDRPR